MDISVGGGSLGEEELLTRRLPHECSTCPMMSRLDVRLATLVINHHPGGQARRVQGLQMGLAQVQVSLAGNFPGLASGSRDGTDA